MSYYDNHKRNSFDTIMYSDPQHMIFVYSPQVKHIRLMELEKCTLGGRDFADNQYNNVQDMHINGVYEAIQEESQWVFRPKRCFLLDSQMATIQKQLQGPPISYHRRYQKLLQQQLKKKIFNWHVPTDQLVLSHNLTQQYYYYQEINNFCFGRRHFVRVLNSIELASDHISRNHCQIAVAKGRGTREIRKYVELLFGAKGQETMNKNKSLRSDKRRKLSKSNLITFIPTQLWQKIYEYIFLTRDKYYLLDSGSRNGSFFIQCPLTINQPTSFEYNIYGNKIDINHKLLIREGYSYEYEGEEYLMKVWRLTYDRMKLHEDEEQMYTSGVQEVISQQFPLYMHNRKTIKNVQEFEEKINWFNNFEKVSKDYIIDQSLLKRNLWKGKKVYEDMIKNNFHRTKRLQSVKKSPNSRSDLRRSQSYEEEDIFQEQNEGNRPNQSYQPFSLLPPNPTSPQNQFITKAQFVRLIYQQFLLMQKMLKQLSNQEQMGKNETKLQLISKIQQEKELTIRMDLGKQQTCKAQSLICPSGKQSFHCQSNDQTRYKQGEQFFISQHQLNAMVISLDFNNDFKKLYCIITEMSKPKKLHIGSQMIINTARFQFDDHNKCNGYIEFDGRNWFIVALKPRNQFMPNSNFAHLRKKAVYGRLTDSEQSEHEEQQEQDVSGQASYPDQFKSQNNTKGKIQKVKPTKGFFQGSKLKNQKSLPNQPNKKKSKQGKKMNLQKQLSCKIWTKIPSMSQFQLNPLKCSRYILRLAHAFYFQLKFLNFTSNTQEYDQTGKANR